MLKTIPLTIGQATLSLECDGDELRSLGAVSVNGAALRNPGTRFLPWFDTYEGDVFGRFRLNEIARRGETTVIRTTAFSNPDVLFRERRDCSGDLCFRTASWDSPACEARLDICIDPAYPPDRVRQSLQSLLRCNFRSDFHGIAQVPRKFVADDDAGLQMITWPRGPRPNPTILYGDEVMTGFEYSAAAAMVQSGLLEDGYLVVKAVSDRYDGARRSEGLTAMNTASWGYSGNPFGDDECGKFYARAMSVWSLLLASQGFNYDGPAAHIGFRPQWRPDDHASFFTGAEGYGLFAQQRTESKQIEKIAVAEGRLLVREMEFELPEAKRAGEVKILQMKEKESAPQGKPLEATVMQDATLLRVHLKVPAEVRAGEAVSLDISLR